MGLTALVVVVKVVVSFAGQAERHGVARRVGGRRVVAVGKSRGNASRAAGANPVGSHHLAVDAAFVVLAFAVKVWVLVFTWCQLLEVVGGDCRDAGNP